jgi:hypothetical protein
MNKGRNMDTDEIHQNYDIAVDKVIQSEPHVQIQS